MKAKYNISMTGFVISFLIIGVIMVFVSMLSSELYANYGTSENSNSTDRYDKYNKYDEINNITDDASQQANINQDIGTINELTEYFSSGFKALKIAWASKNIFNDMVDDASEDVPVLGFIMQYFLLIVTVLIVIGVIISVFFKMRI